MDQVDDRTTIRLQDLLDRLNAGDDAARSELIGHAYARLERLARGQLRGFPVPRRTRETGDILNDAVLSLDRALRQIRPRTVREFFGLAALHMRRILLDLIRRGREHGAGGAGTGSPGVDPVDSATGPSAFAEQVEFHERVEALQPPEREIFDLLYYQGLPQADAAALLGISERTVKRRWRAARLALEESLGGGRGE